MPFTAADVKKHKKGLSAKQSERWVAIANSVLSDCEGETSFCEGKAIRIANARSVKGEPGDLLDITRLLFGDGDERDTAREIVGSKDHLMAPGVPGNLFAGGVTSFEELDRWRDFMERIGDARAVLWDAEDLIDNVLALAEPGMLDITMVEDILEETVDRLPAAVTGEKATRRSILGRIAAMLKRKDRGAPVEPTVQGTGPLLIRKEADGRTRWSMLVSTNVRDLDGEIMTAEGQRLNVAAMKTTGNYPEAWIAHVKGTRWGLADYAEYIDDVFMVSGLVDPGMEEVAQRLAEKSADLSVSHGFVDMRRGTDTRDIERFVTFEVSPLPRKAAAQPWLGIIIEENDKMNDAEKATLKEAVGDELAAKMIENVAAVATATTGLDSKATGDPSTDPPTEPEPPDPAAALDAEAIRGLVRAQIAELAPPLVKAAMEPLNKALESVITDLKSVTTIAEVLKATNDEQIADILTKARGGEPYVASKKGTETDAAAIGEPGAGPGADGGGEGIPVADEAQFMSADRWLGRAGGKQAKEPEPVTG